MTTAPTALVRVHWHHPEWVALVIAVVAWLGLAAPVATSPAALLRATHHPGIGVLGHAAVMAGAMMAPLVLPQAHDLAVSSLWPRRYRGTMCYLAGYLAVWTLVGAAMMTGLHVLVPRTGALPLVALTGAVAVVVAATEDHRRRLRRCGATRPLALTGWHADRDCADAGVRMAGRCAATTWAMMLAVMAQGGLVVLVAGTAYMVAERRGHLRDAQLARWTLALALVAVTLTALVVRDAGSPVPGLPVDPHLGH